MESLALEGRGQGVGGTNIGGTKDPSISPDGTQQKLLDVSCLHALGWQQKHSMHEGHEDFLPEEDGDSNTMNADGSREKCKELLHSDDFLCKWTFTLDGDDSVYVNRNKMLSACCSDKPPVYTIGTRFAFYLGQSTKEMRQ